MIEGGCYCGALRYQAAGDLIFKGQCHCRPCQYISGGGPNLVVGLPEQGFSYTRGEPREYRRQDLPNPVSRDFCADCGTHLLTRSPHLEGVVLVKVGSLDDPSLFDRPDQAIWTREMQSFHHIPEGVPRFEAFPERAR